jgi:hypothetical protein
MALFKYFNPNVEYDPLGECKLMVTPPKYLEDPFEWTPTIKCKDPGECVRQTFKKISASPDYYNMHKMAFPRVRNFDEFREGLGQKKAELFETLERGVRQTDRNTQNEMLEFLSASFGIICFTGDGVNQIMWDRYALAHTGFAIEFHEDHRLFSGRSFLRVEYSNEPVLYDASGFPNRDQVERFIKRKMMKWRAEDESRLIVDLNYTVPSITPKGVRHFLPITPELIVSVTLGSRASEEVERKTIGALCVARFRHAKLFRISQHDDRPELYRRPLPFCHN